MSLIGIILNGIVLYFVSYGVVHHRGKRSFTGSDLEGDPNSSKEKHKDKITRYVFIGICLIVAGNIFQNISIFSK